MNVMLIKEINVNKEITKIICLVSLILLLGCDKDDDLNLKNTIRDQYLVEKITFFEDVSNYKSTEYFYDNNNRLIRRLTTGKILENNQVRELKYVDVFEYKNGLISKIHILDSTYFKFSYDVNLFYNSQGDLIRQENWKNGYMIGNRNFFYENNKMVSIYNDDTEPFETNRIVYNDLGNVIKHIYIFPEQDRGTYKEVEYLYEYDNGLRPNFGIDYVFVYDPLVGMGTETGFARELSLNNLTKYVNSGTTWTFTYDKNGLPIQYEIKWKDTETLYPIIFKIINKRIK